MQRIGLTGGIGSGKSTVLETLQALGAATADADAIARGVTAAGGAAIPAIRERFGAGFIAADGSMDRARMRAHAFAEPAARRELEAIIHPLVSAAIREREALARAEGRACLVFDIPLLVESGRWRAQLDRVLVVDCRPETQVARVMARSGLAREEVQAIIDAQAPRRLRLAAADVVVFNEGLSLAQLAQTVTQAARGFGL
ncbi:dephospho-CoA kinase [Ramlibacter sp. MAHUQ-53]|uniref:dephospho-CoA kinase n=1 Tax=unclassified Ramlibacter TaxID=2617605 RepID=UPI003637B48F